MSSNNNSNELCEKLWNEYEPSLRKICNYKLSSYPSEIDDVIGDTYLALCKALDNGVEINKPKAWLYGTLNNLIKLKYAEINKRKKYLVDFESVEYDLSYDIDFDDEKVSEEMLQKLKEEILEELTESENTLLVLIYDRKLKLKEVARIIDTTESAVKQKHYRLKRKIKKLAKNKMRNFK